MTYAVEKTGLDVPRDWVIAATVSAARAAFSGLQALSDVEIAQGARFLRSEDGERYRAAHLLKRHLLGATTGERPQELQFDREVNGKPVLRGITPLDFNLSHSDDWVIAGVSLTGRIGVDVEAERPEPFWREIAGSFLTPAELVAARDSDFLKFWTAKEAGLKAHGAGFAIMPNGVTVAEDGDGFAMQVESMVLRCSWQGLDETHMLAVATTGDMPEIAICRNAAELTAALERISVPVSAAASG
ncbi:4'-phosphopantetheinyl transferase superfamily protein [Neorhizobium sp. JUb45]|uniref:4'-phosphopantetheinyl transferase family protein n=1 Tax=unclassified Neorhizobium TaxID=2629175 RepID=UPI00104DCEA0|nr:4'-phosphopantetheinyl transferase superfamily protein [Neorhizobium sp. JUb45]TCR03166.1 phosphopantetheinyl transferase [Neorhizobium sp. JUb45]